MNKLKLNKTNKQLTPQLNHHSPQSRRSRPLAQALPTSQRRWNSSSHKQGFTIIEVVLVLAIAGLIFLMVFIALPALQRNQRDTQRKNDISRLQVAFENYRANNRGKLPDADYFNPPGGGGRILQSSDFGKNYLDGDNDGFVDPSGTPYLILWPPVRPEGYIPGPDENQALHIIRLASNMRCSGSSLTSVGAGPNNFSLQIRLEGGGIYCVNN